MGKRARTAGQLVKTGKRVRWAWAKMLQVHSCCIAVMFRCDLMSHCDTIYPICELNVYPCILVQSCYSCDLFSYSMWAVSHMFAWQSLSNRLEVVSD